MDSMENRRENIVAFINERREISFLELKDAFPNVSEMTLRTDLKSLDEEKRIIRVHGGAKAINTVFENDDLLHLREVRNVSGKEKVVAKALELIRPNMTIFLDSGSTTTMLARELPDQPMVIFTSSVTCAVELSKLTEPKVYLLGGELNKNSLSIYGSRAIEMLHDVRFDLALLGVTCYSEEAGFTCGAYEEALLKQTALRSADQAYIMMDLSKVGTRKPYHICDVSDVTGVLTDGETF